MCSLVVPLFANGAAMTTTGAKAMRIPKIRAVLTNLSVIVVSFFLSGFKRMLSSRAFS